MNRLKKSLLFIGANLLIYGIAVVVLKPFHSPASLILFTGICLFIFLPIGLFFGFLINYLRDSTNKKAASYSLGLSVSFVFTFLIMFTLVATDTSAPVRDNAYHNRDLLKFGETRNQPEALVAYTCLAKQFHHENDLRLDGGSSKVVDSQLNGFREDFTFYNFKYFVKNDTTLYVAKIQVHLNEPQIIFFNREAKLDEATRISDSIRDQTAGEMVNLTGALLDSINYYRERAKQ